MNPLEYLSTRREIERSTVRYVTFFSTVETSSKVLLGMCCARDVTLDRA